VGTKRVTNPMPSPLVNLNNIYHGIKDICFKGKRLELTLVFLVLWDGYGSISYRDSWMEL
jgi:hypothetical protein